MISLVGKRFTLYNIPKICQLGQKCQNIRFQCLIDKQLKYFSSTGGRKITYKANNDNLIENSKNKQDIEQEKVPLLNQQLLDVASQNSPQIQNAFKQFMLELSQINDTKDYQLYLHTIERYINQHIFSFTIQLKNDDSFEKTKGSLFLTNPYLLNNYSQALLVKSATQFRFRKFDNILTNLENQMYMLIYLNLNNKMRKRVNKLCDIYLMTLAFYNHDLLRDFLYKDYTKLDKKKNDLNIESDEKGGQRRGRKVVKKKKKTPNGSAQSNDQEYEQLQKQKPKSIDLSFKPYMLNFQQPQTYFVKSIAYAIIGQSKQSLQFTCKLLNKQRKNKQYLSLLTTIYIHFGHQNYQMSQGKNYQSDFLHNFLKNVLCNSSQQNQPVITLQSFPARISLQDSEYYINSVLSFLHNKQVKWTDLIFEELQYFCFPLYLIAENYYLSGETIKGEIIVNELRKKILSQNGRSQTNQKQNNQKRGRKIANKINYALNVTLNIQKQKYLQNQVKTQLKSNLLMLVNFFELMRCYDQKNFDKIVQYQAQFTEQQKKCFYESGSVKNDILRSNIYQIFSQTFKELKNTQKEEQYSSLSAQNHAVNDTYEINNMQDITQPEAKQIFQQLNPTKAGRVNKKGILPHYLPFVSSNIFVSKAQKVKE